MNTFKLTAAQGEIALRRIGDIPPDGFPAGFTPMKAENGKFIIGHSETGHHHVMDARHMDVAVMDRPPEGMRVLYLIVQNPNSLVHERGHDTHKSIDLEPGAYEARIQREYDPYQELARQVAD